MQDRRPPLVREAHAAQTHSSLYRGKRSRARRLQGFRRRVQHLKDPLGGSHRLGELTVKSSEGPNRGNNEQHVHEHTYQLADGEAGFQHLSPPVPQHKGDCCKSQECHGRHEQRPHAHPLQRGLKGALHCCTEPDTLVPLAPKSLDDPHARKGLFQYRVGLPELLLCLPTDAAQTTTEHPSKHRYW